MQETIGALVAGARRLLIISHVAPDGDAIGSLLGATWMLRLLGKKVVAASQDGTPSSLRFLPAWQTIVHEVNDNDFDLIITLDCSDRERLGAIYNEQLHGGLPLINIDHHVTNLYFGTVNLVDSEATSTAEVLFRLAQKLGWPLNPAAAQCLLTGVVTDTHCFRTANVTASVLDIAQQLMEAGASLSLITENVMNRRPVASVCLWSRALANVQFEGRIVWSSISHATRAACQLNNYDNFDLVNYLISIEQADVAALFSEREEGTVDVSLRAASGVDVSQVALSLGGGGHPRAAGCTLQGTLPAVQARVLAALHAALGG